MSNRTFAALAALLVTGIVAQPAHAFPGRWNVGAGMGDVEVLYGRFGDHEIIIGCSPRWNTLSMKIGLVAPRSDYRGQREGVMIVRLGDHELRFAGSIGPGIVEVIVREFTDDYGRDWVETQPDSTRLLHVMRIHDDRRPEIDAFLDLLTTQPGEPMFIEIEGEPTRARIGPNARVRSARAVREACPAQPPIS